MSTKARLAPLLVLVVVACDSTNSWPVEATDKGHPVGNSSREFQQYGVGSPYYHGGMDVREPPAPGGPWLRSVGSGTVSISYNANPIYHGITIRTADTTDFGYWHVDSASITAAVLDAWTNGTVLASNVRMGQIVRWTDCGFHHVHFFRKRPAGETDPMVFVRPHDETTAPTINDVFFARNATDVYFGGVIPTVSGDVDIVADISDQIFTTAHLTGAYNVKYKIQRRIGFWIFSFWWTVQSAADVFPSVFRPAQSTASVVFQTAAPHASSSNYCGTETYFYVLTNGVASSYDDAMGFWDTDGGGFPNGRYRVRMTARDASGNSRSRSQEVTVSN